MNTSALAVGQIIELNDGRSARVRFVGSTLFQTGDWVGVELEEPTGKNDGSVKGERYFDCEQGYGMFVRATGVRAVLEAAPKPQSKPGKEAAAAGAGRSRQSTVHGGLNGVKKTDTAPGRRMSTMAASPTPGARASRLSGIRSPTKSPTKQLASNGTSSSSTSRTATPSAVGARKPGVAATSTKPRPSVAGGTTTTSRRTSMAPSTVSSSRTSRSSLAPSSTTSRTAPGRTQPGRESIRSAQAEDHTETKQPRTYSQEEIQEEDEEEDAEQPNETMPGLSEADSAQDDEDTTEKPSFAPLPPPPIPPDPTPRAGHSRRGSSPPASVHSQRTARNTAVSTRHVEELEAKIRLLERKRLEDRDVKRSLEQAQQERDKYQGIIEKLQKKYQPQQQELVDLKKALADAEARSDQTEKFQAEHDSIMEMATLDKEMAEETAEALQVELDSLRARQEEMELELEVLRDENTEFGKEMSPEERTSAGWLQMERENDRLRNALLRLRDLTQDREEELKSDLAELQDQVKDLEKIKRVFDETKDKLQAAEDTADDLRQQLEAALGAEEMIEELTERNMTQQERMDELRGNIEDLENLKELNDELEVNHIEAEKQMQEEIEFKDALIMDRDRVAKQQQAALDDADYTINRFRDLVSQMQNDLQDMQATKQISETEAADLESKSRAMRDLNMRLQSSAAKTQVKTIDLELRKLDAQEASEHLAIVQLFLPDAFHAERDSVLALLRFKRISFKAGLLQSFVKERVASFGTRGQDESVFAAVDVLNNLNWIAGTAERFVNSICTCSIDHFTRYENALYEIEPVERALNSHVDALRRDEVRESDMAGELQRSMAVMLHLASMHLTDDLASHADDLIARMSYLQAQLEGTASALGAMKALLEANANGGNAEQDGEDEEDTTSNLKFIIDRAETLSTHARSAKVMAGKTSRALLDLQDRSLTLEPTCTDGLESVENVAREIAAYTRLAGESLQDLFNEEGRSKAFSASDIFTAISSAASSAFSLPSPEAGPFTAIAEKLRSLSDLLVDIAALPTDLDNTVEFERAPAPWVARANELKQHKLTAQDTEAELARATESLRERDILVRSKETELEEQSVRIEMLEARMREAVRRSGRIVELERTVQEAKDGEKRARHELDRARREAQGELDRVRGELSRAAQRGQSEVSSTNMDGGAMGVGAKMALKRQVHQITSLQAAVRFLKEENQRLRLPTADAPRALTKSLDWLHEPLLKHKSDRQRRQDAVQKEGKDVLQRLRDIAIAPNIIDLTTLPENKLAWRPMKESSRWQVEHEKEDWLTWRHWRDDVVRDVIGLKRGEWQVLNDIDQRSKERLEAVAPAKILNEVSPAELAVEEK